MTRPDFSPYSLLPLAVGVVVWTVLLDLLTRHRRAARPRWRRPGAGSCSAPAAWPSRPSRSGSAAGSSDGPAGRSRPRRRLLRLPVTRRHRPRGRRARRRRGLAPWRVAERRTSTGSTPRWWCPPIDPDEWKLRIHGHGRPGDHDHLPASWSPGRLTEDWVTICCVSNPVGGDLIGNAWWSGVRIADLLARGRGAARRRRGQADLRRTAGPAAPRSRRSPTTATRCWPWR